MGTEYSHRELADHEHPGADRTRSQGRAQRRPRKVDATETTHDSISFGVGRAALSYGGGPGRIRRTTQLAVSPHSGGGGPGRIRRTTQLAVSPHSGGGGPGRIRRSTQLAVSPRPGGGTGGPEPGKIQRAARSGGDGNGLPTGLKFGIESLSGVSMDDVRVHRNSSRPGRLDALAYTRGTEIFVGPGHEDVVAHEAWHVVQQARGGVRPTVRADGGVAINDDQRLEREADLMGARAVSGAGVGDAVRPDGDRLVVPSSGGDVAQMAWGAYDGKDRGDARGVLVALGLMNPFNAALGAVLEEAIHFGAAPAVLQAAYGQMPNAFSSAVRATSVANSLNAGLPLAFAQVAVQACPLDNGRLDPLLALFGQFNAAGIGAPALALAQVCSQLLVNGVGAVPLQAALVQMPNAFSTAVRATSVANSLNAGLPLAFAQVAVQACPLDNGRLDPLLALFGQFNAAGIGAPALALAQVCSQLLVNGVGAVPLQAAWVQMPNDFTSVVRATSLINALQGGLRLAFAQVAVQACPIDNGRLDPLLGLFGRLDAAGVGVPALALVQVCSGLLANGEDAGAVATAVQNVPVLLTTVPRASAILAHTAAGGTDADARRAARFAPADDAVLVEALTAVRGLAAVPKFAMLGEDLQFAVLSERAALTTDVLRTNAVATAAGATSELAATAELTRTRAFGFRTDVTKHVEDAAKQHRKTVEDEGAKRIASRAEKARQQAFDKYLQEATASLTRNQGKALAFPASEKGKEAMALRAAKQKELAAGDITTIDEQAKTDLAEVRQTTGPTALTDKTAELQQWFASVAHHPDALAALKAAQHDLGLASGIITMIVADHSTRQSLVGSGLTPPEIGRLLTLAPAQLAHVIGGGMSTAELKAFAASDDRSRVLNAAAVALVPVANIKGLVASFDVLKAQIASPSESGHLVTLLATTTAAEIVALRNATPDDINAKLGLVAAIRANAATAGELTQVLTFCKSASWDQQLITATIGGLPAAQTLAQLQNAVYPVELNRYNKFSHFASWLYAVDRLVEAHHLNVQANGDWIRLNGACTTDERNYNVTIVATGAAAGTFCVHYHPGALPPDVKKGLVNVSKTHLKPERGGTVRYLSPNLLNSIRPRIQLSP